MLFFVGFSMINQKQFTKLYRLLPLKYSIYFTGMFFTELSQGTVKKHITSHYCGNHGSVNVCQWMVKHLFRHNTMIASSTNLAIFIKNHNAQNFRTYKIFVFLKALIHEVLCKILRKVVKLYQLIKFVYSFSFSRIISIILKLKLK